MKNNKKPRLHRFFYSVVKFFYYKYDFVIKQPIAPGGHVFVANHAQAHGPISMTIYFPRKKKIWVIGEMCNKNEVVDFVMEDWWRNKKCQWFFRLVAKLIIKPLVCPLMCSADTIPVYKDTRLRQTMKNTIEALKNDTDVIIFPECREKHNKYINEFQTHFVDVASIYARGNSSLYFYPTYVVPNLKKVIIGEGILFNPNEDINVERERITKKIQETITNLGEELPRHRIVPYDNVSKKEQIFSKEKNSTKN